MTDQTPEQVEGTEVEETTEETAEETVENPTEPEVDWKKKFTESSAGVEGLLNEKETLQRELEDLKNKPDNESGVTYDNDSELYQGFEDLSDAEKENVRSYTNSITKKVVEDLYKDPAIVSAQQSHNEREWDKTFSELRTEIPELSDMSDEFKTKHFNKDNVPSNIKEIMTQLAKSELFDKAKDLGSKEAIEQANTRIDIERSGGGDKTPKTTRSMEDWHKLAQDNPAKFAKMSKEYNEDVNSGKL